MKCARFVYLAVMVTLFMLFAYGCGGGGGSADVDRVCYTASGDFEPFGTECDDGLCFNGTHKGMCDGAGTCVVQPQATLAGECTVFLSSDEYDGALGGLAGADRVCQRLADAEGLPGTFKAWLSDSATSAAERMTQSAVPYKDVLGRTIADNWHDLTDGFLQTKIFTDEKGFVYEDSPGCNPVFIVLGAGGVWTNTLLDGSGAGGPSCTNWTDNRSSEDGGEGGRAGLYCFDTQTWTEFFGLISGCHSRRSLYCFQQ